MKTYNILLLGSGGRENAFAWKLNQSQFCNQLYIAPGNAGTNQFGTNVALSMTDFAAIKEFCLSHEIGLVLPGGEDALVAGIYDFFQKDVQLQSIIVAGPSQKGAQLEGSKAFAKQFMQRHQIPTASYREFDNASFDEGIAFLKQHPLPVVIKADGLAAGKGVIIAQTTEEALNSFSKMIRDAQFGDAGKKVVIEEFLTGIELSVFVLTDGTHWVLLPEAKDYKRIGESDTGLNTGGMGAISPVPFADANFMNKVREQIVKSTVEGLKKEQIEYKGFIFLGLISVNGNPYVIEYNCRMGDPETEVVMPRLKNDLVELLDALWNERLNEITIHSDVQAAATVMLVSGGYPNDYEKGKKISGLQNVKNSILFHAGTLANNQDVLTNGGRVIAVSSLAPTLKEALEVSYHNANLVDFEGKYYRKDIGFEFQ
ncbi:MAG: phosphoribosylamine--glycine ligase [Bacteroidetes bacterium]|nr:phosphoribosylamine--glycine ligase [Bacteroidota bacterium]